MSQPIPPTETEENEDASYSSSRREAYFNDPETRRKLVRRRERWELIYKLFLGGVALVAASLIGFLWYLSAELPSLEQLENPKPALATEVRSGDGLLLTKYFIENRRVVPIDSISKHVTNALLATEDREFYSHWGFSTRRTIIATIENIVYFKPFKRWHGASTVTQQLARNLYMEVGKERGITRKIRELMTAVQIERTYTKDEILSLYLNTVYFGNGAHGIEAAAMTYFGKNAIRLNAEEAALLIAVLKSPEDYNPIRKAQAAKSRRNLVLGMMAAADYLKGDEAEKFKAQELKLTFTPITSMGISPYFTEYVRQQLEQLGKEKNFDPYRDGMVVYTTLDTRMQAYADTAATKQMKWLQEQFDKSWKWTESEKNDIINETGEYRALREKGMSEKDALAKLKEDKKFVETVMRDKGTVQCAFTAIDPATGFIKAWVGGRDFGRYKFDHVWQAHRQPGSTFKAFAYTAALENGIPPNTQFLNQPIALKMPDGNMWMPNNSDNSIGGYITMRNALQKSLNFVTVRLVQEKAPVSRIVSLAKRMGITSPIQENQSIALGTSEVTPLELTSAFGTFANNGVHVAPTAILRVENKDGATVWQAPSPDKVQALDRAVNYIAVTLLQGVMNGGTGSAARSRYNFRQEAGGKTGTSQKQIDAWFVGFTPSLAAGAWTGFDDQRIHFKSMEYGQGARAALPIWAEFMKACYADKSLALPTRYFARPDGVYAVPISVETNQPADEGATKVYTEFFTKKMLESPEYRTAGNFIRAGADTTHHKAPTQQVSQQKRGEGEF